MLGVEQPGDEPGNRCPVDDAEGDRRQLKVRYFAKVVQQRIQRGLVGANRVRAEPAQVGEGG